MISLVLFSHSGLCLAAMFAPDRKSKPGSTPIITYYVCDSGPMPTCHKRAAGEARVRV